MLRILTGGGYPRRADGRSGGRGNQNRRAEIITEQEALIIDSWCEQQVGKEIDVLVDGFDRYAECFFGRSAFDAPEVDPNVFFNAERKPRPGEIVRVRITDHIDCDLTGEMV